MKKRCAWVPINDSLYTEYHDREWGVPVHNDQKLFEFLVLEGFQAGLSWRTILYKRDNFRKAFDDFNPLIVATYSEEKIQSLLQDSGIVRNQLKVRAAVENAKAFIRIQDEYDSFDKYIWGFINGKSLKNQFKFIRELPASTPLSDKISNDLKRRGFKFVGTTVCYAHMQATGMVNDHTIDCFRYNEVQ